MLRFASLLLVLLVSATAVAQTGIPDLNQSTLERDDTGPSALSIMVVPDGSGPPLTQAVRPDGTIASAGLTATVRDGANFPVANFPFEDLWLESFDGDLAPCIGGTTADANTDINGQTRFETPLRAGGWTEGPLLLMLNGMAIVGSEVAIRINSPDSNGDGAVNMTDLATFAADYHGAYHFRSDFNFDGSIDLGDVVILAAKLGGSCP